MHTLGLQRKRMKGNTRNKSGQSKWLADVADWKKT